MSIIQGTAKGGVVATSFYDFPIEQSLRFDGSSYLIRTFGTPTENKVWTFSLWIKIADTSTGFIPIMEAYTGGSDKYNTVALNANKIRLVQDEGSGGVILQDSISILRDTSAWYHLTVGFDNTSGTSLAEKYFFYINGVNNTTSNTTITTETPYINKSGLAVKISGRWTGTAAFKGYMANIQFIDGQALDASYFGETKNDIWVPKAYTGSYGNNGFHLDFADSSNIGNDVSGNNNDWTVN